MDSGIVLSDLGAVQGTIDGATADHKFLAVELKVTKRKTISNIACSFQVPSGQTRTTRPFTLGRVIVVRKELAALNFTMTPYQDTGSQKLEFDHSFIDYDGFIMPCYLTAEKNEILSVILFPGVLDVAAPAVASLAGSLSIQGVLTDDSSIKLRAL